MEAARTLNGAPAIGGRRRSGRSRRGRRAPGAYVKTCALALALSMPACSFALAAKVTAAEVSGHASVRARDVLAVLGVAEGSEFDVNAVGAGADSLLSLYAGLGRPFARVSASWDSTAAGVAVFGVDRRGARGEALVSRVQRRGRSRAGRPPATARTASGRSSHTFVALRGHRGASARLRRQREAVRRGRAPEVGRAVGRRRAERPGRGERGARDLVRRRGRGGQPRHAGTRRRAGERHRARRGLQRDGAGRRAAETREVGLPRFGRGARSGRRPVERRGHRRHRGHGGHVEPDLGCTWDTPAVRVRPTS